jgi:phosphohistidine phosphatase
MELILWRHADAEEGMHDEERRLTAKGVKQAKRMAAWLKPRLPKDVLILASPARRARETAQVFSKRFKTSAGVGTTATPRSVLEAANWPRGRKAVLVVGHQPTLGQVVGLLLMGRPVEMSFKKGAIWWLTARGDDEVTVRAVIAPDLL